MNPRRNPRLRAFSQGINQVAIYTERRAKIIWGGSLIVAGITACCPNIGQSKAAQSLNTIPVKAFLDRGKNIRYYEMETANRSKATFIVVPVVKSHFEIKPVVNRPTCPTSEAAKKEAAIAAINAGYFNLKDGVSTSFVTVNGQEVSNPRENQALINNPKLKPYLSSIFNRSELRFVTDKKGKISIHIQAHSEALPPGFVLKHAIQAGPRLLPKITAEEEAFIRREADGTVTDAIGCLKTAARTAFGITADRKAVLLCVSGQKQDEFSAGVTLQELADLLQELGCVEAINFDGGTSSTMAIKSELLKRPGGSSAVKPDAGSNHGGGTVYSGIHDAEPSAEKLSESGTGYTVVCGRHPETRVKSNLVLKLDKQE